MQQKSSCANLNAAAKSIHRLARQLMLQSVRIGQTNPAPMHSGMPSHHPPDPAAAASAVSTRLMLEGAPRKQMTGRLLDQVWHSTQYKRCERRRFDRE